MFVFVIVQTTVGLFALGNLFFHVLTLGARDVFKVKSPDEVFDTLEKLLWDHANKVRGAITGYRDTGYRGKKL